MERLKASGGGAELVVDIAVAGMANGEYTAVKGRVDGGGCVRSSDQCIGKAGKQVDESCHRRRAPLS